MAKNATPLRQFALTGNLTGNRIRFRAFKLVVEEVLKWHDDALAQEQ